MSLRIPRCMLPILMGLALVAGILMLLGTDAQASDRVAPVLIDRFPAPNAIAANVNSAVQATYDQDMDLATVTYQTFAVHAMQTGWLTETLAVQGGMIVLTPSLPFHPGEWVHVSATTGTLSLGAEGPISPTVWQFTTGVGGGTATFLDSGQRLDDTRDLGLALGDLDGDGDLDAVMAIDPGPNQVYFNDGTGVFTNSGQDLVSSASQGIVLGDLDGDGDLDAFEARRDDQPNLVWWNDGAGQFSDSGQSLGASNSWYPALGDLDGDGDLDAFVPNGTQNVTGTAEANLVYLNNGNGIFVDSGQSLGLRRSVDVALGDLDSDGDLDAFVINGGFWTEPNEIWFNDGHGVFSLGQTLSAGRSDFVDLGDIDGDGDLDALVTYYNTQAGGQADEIWLNNGEGEFSLTQLLGSEQSLGAAFGDLDGDGDLDAFVCQVEGGVIWLNDGSGSFSRNEPGLNFCFFPGLGDLDSDGDLDAFLANALTGEVGIYPNEVWFNEPLLDLFLPLIARE